MKQRPYLHCVNAAALVVDGNYVAQLRGKYEREIAHVAILPDQLEIK